MQVQYQVVTTASAAVRHAAHHAGSPDRSRRPVAAAAAGRLPDGHRDRDPGPAGNVCASVCGFTEPDHRVSRGTAPSSKLTRAGPGGCAYPMERQEAERRIRPGAPDEADPGTGLRHRSDPLHCTPARGRGRGRRLVPPCSVRRRREVGDGVRSVAEGDLRVLILGSDLPKPMFNARLFDANGVFIATVDDWWQDAGVAGEVDSRAYHLSAEDQDRTTERQTDPAAIIRELHLAINAGRRRPPLPITALPAAG